MVCFCQKVQIHFQINSGYINLINSNYLGVWVSFNNIFTILIQKREIFGNLLNRGGVRKNQENSRVLLECSAGLLEMRERGSKSSICSQAQIKM